MKKLWFLEQQIIKGSNGVRKTKRNTPPLWKQRSKVMVREVTLVSLALFMVFLFAGAAESFGNPLTIKADSTRWATWEDGERTFSALVRPMMNAGTEPRISMGKRFVCRQRSRET